MGLASAEDVHINIQSQDVITIVYIDHKPDGVTVDSICVL